MSPGILVTQQTKHRSRLRVEAGFLINMIGYNLMRLPALIPSQEKSVPKPPKQVLTG